MNRLITNLRQFKLITFDITDTLLKFRRPPGEEYAIAVQQFGYRNVSAAEISSQFGGNFKYMTTTYPNFGCTTIGWENWWRMLVQRILTAAKVDIDGDSVVRVADYIIAKYQTDECWVRVENANELIDTLKECGKTVGVLSNFDPRLRCILADTKLSQFDFVLSSYEHGVAKPSQAIFDLALEMVGKAKPTQALHVGNTPTLDYIGAIEAGWSAALITNDDNGWKDYPIIKPEHTFSSISELLCKLKTDDIKW